jgi:hypothetical protein
MKKTYRVTYEESILRVATAEAADETSAIELITQQLADGEHHHAVEVWDHAWSAEPAQKHPSVNARCFECGARRG